MATLSLCNNFLAITQSYTEKTQVTQKKRPYILLFINLMQD